MKTDRVVIDTNFSEYVRVLNRPKFGFDAETIDGLPGALQASALRVEVNEEDYPQDEMPDKTDAPFYVAARATGARLVTGNLRHYPVSELRTMLWEMKG